MIRTFLNMGFDVVKQLKTQNLLYYQNLIFSSSLYNPLKFSNMLNYLRKGSLIVTLVVNLF